MSNLPTYQFGPFILNAGERLLHRGEVAVPLTLKAFETLLVLVKNKGKIIEKDKLLTEIWADTFVEEATLAQNIFTLRKALGKDENGRSYIETSQRRGYRFAAPVTVIEKDDIAITDSSIALQLKSNVSVSGKPDKIVLNSIAVLEMDNVCEDASFDYLSEGITENVINSLSRLSSLRVMSRSTVIQYKGKGITPVEVGRKLGVLTVLVGKLLRLEGQLIIRVALVDVEDGRQIWGEQYNKKISDIFKIQQDVASQITSRLQSKLTTAEHKQLAVCTTQSIEAYELYLKGRYFWNKRSSEGFRQAKDSFREAINIDPDFALAYSGYADAYCLECVGFYGVQPPREVIPNAKLAALKSIELNDQLSEGYTSLAYILLNYDWDWEGAERDFKHALVIADSAHAHHWYSHYLTSLGRGEESLIESKRALEIDPFDATINQHIGWHYLFARQYEQAIEQLKATLELNPDFYPSHILLGLAYVHNQQYDKAIDEFQEALLLEQLSPAKAFLGYGYAMSGQRAKAIEVLDDLLAPSTKVYVSPYDIARIHVGLDDKEEAFIWLQRAFEERSEWIAMIKINPELDSLRDDPRFKTLLRRMSLDQ